MMKFSVFAATIIATVTFVASSAGGRRDLSPVMVCGNEVLAVQVRMAASGQLQR